MKEILKEKIISMLSLFDNVRELEKHELEDFNYGVCFNYQDQTCAFVFIIYNDEWISGRTYYQVDNSLFSASSIWKGNITSKIDDVEILVKEEIAAVFSASREIISRYLKATKEFTVTKEKRKDMSARLKAAGIYVSDGDVMINVMDVDQELFNLLVKKRGEKR